MDLLGDTARVVCRDHRLVVGASDGDDDIARGGGVIVGTGIVLHRDGVVTVSVSPSRRKSSAPSATLQVQVALLAAWSTSAERQLGGSNDCRIGHVVAIAVTVDRHSRGVSMIDLVNIGEVYVGIACITPPTLCNVSRIAGLIRGLGNRIAELFICRGDHRLVVGAGNGRRRRSGSPSRLFDAAVVSDDNIVSQRQRISPSARKSKSCPAG